MMLKPFVVVIYLPGNPDRPRSRRRVPVVGKSFPTEDAAQDWRRRVDTMGHESKIVTAAQAARYKWQSLASYEKALNYDCACPRRAK